MNASFSGCLTLAELGRRGLLLPQRLPDGQYLELSMYVCLLLMYLCIEGIKLLIYITFFINSKNQVLVLVLDCKSMNEYLVLPDLQFKFNI